MLMLNPNLLHGTSSKIKLCLVCDQNKLSQPETTHLHTPSSTQQSVTAPGIQQQQQTFGPPYQSVYYPSYLPPNQYAQYPNPPSQYQFRWPVYPMTNTLHNPGTNVNTLNPAYTTEDMSQEYRQIPPFFNVPMPQTNLPQQSNSTAQNSNFFVPTGHQVRTNNFQN